MHITEGPQTVKGNLDGLGIEMNFQNTGTPTDPAYNVTLTISRLVGGFPVADVRIFDQLVKPFRSYDEAQDATLVRAISLIEAGYLEA